MAKNEDKSEGGIAIFQRKEVRRTLHNNEWWFVVADVVVALTDTPDAVSYTHLDAADERSSVDLGGRRIIKKKNQ